MTRFRGLTKSHGLEEAFERGQVREIPVTDIICKEYGLPRHCAECHGMPWSCCGIPSAPVEDQGQSMACRSTSHGAPKNSIVCYRLVGISMVFLALTMEYFRMLRNPMQLMDFHGKAKYAMESCGGSWLWKISVMLAVHHGTSHEIYR